jgi:hypothetical protein
VYGGGYRNSRLDRAARRIEGIQLLYLVGCLQSKGRERGDAALRIKWRPTECVCPVSCLHKYSALR